MGGDPIYRVWWLRADPDQELPAMAREITVREIVELGALYRKETKTIQQEILERTGEQRTLKDIEAQRRSVERTIQQHPAGRQPAVGKPLLRSLITHMARGMTEVDGDMLRDLALAANYSPDNLRQLYEAAAEQAARRDVKAVEALVLKGIPGR
jgi:hypothetical protein